MPDLFIPGIFMRKMILRLAWFLTMNTTFRVVNAYAAAFSEVLPLRKVYRNMFITITITLKVFLLELNLFINAGNISSTAQITICSALHCCSEISFSASFSSSVPFFLFFFYFFLSPCLSIYLFVYLPSLYFFPSPFFPSIVYLFTY